MSDLLFAVNQLQLKRIFAADRVNRDATGDQSMSVSEQKWLIASISSKSIEDGLDAVQDVGLIESALRENGFSTSFAHELWDHCDQIISVVKRPKRGRSR